MKKFLEVKKFVEVCLLAGACVALVLPEACATTTQSTLVTTQRAPVVVSDAGSVVGAAVAVTCVTLNALGQSFLSTGTVLDAAFDSKLVSKAAYSPWHDFALRFAAAYRIADKACEAAVKGNDQTVQGVVAAEMAEFQTQLIQFITLAARAGTGADGGTP